MNRIDTDISSLPVEIEDREYPVAEKTIAVAEQLLTARKRLDGEPIYKLWLAELDILLGKPATRELFPNGNNENIDRLQRIHAGVLRAFDHNAEELQAQEAERQREKLAYMSDVLRQIATLAKAENKPVKPVIHRQ